MKFINYDDNLKDIVNIICIFEFFQSFNNQSICI